MTLLARFLASLPSDDTTIRSEVAAYVAWQEGRSAVTFAPTGDDDVEVRNYLLHLKLEGAGRRDLHTAARSLQRFYRWLKVQNLIAYDPFDFFDFDRPFLTRDQIRRRDDRLPASPQEREIARLRALNVLTENLNRAVEAQGALDTALSSLLAVMTLDTGWVFLLPESRHPDNLEKSPFGLAAASGLPSGLERQDRRFLCQPPDCHCQHLLREGRLTRAVNIVECTRLQDSAKAEGDNRDLYFHASLPLFIAGKPVGLVNLATSEWQFLTAADLEFLSIAGTQISAALERARLYDWLQAQEMRLSQELDMARQVQASLLPASLPDIPGYELAAHWQAAREVAGDFYDAFRLPDGRLGLVIADVAGKGAPAALYMAMARSLIQAAVDHHDRPSAVLLELNKALSAHVETGLFVTVFYGILDPATGFLTYANAGHDPPLIRQAEGSPRALRDHGPLLGVLSEIELPDATVTLAPGDALLLYSDGLTEAINDSEEIFAQERLQRALARAPSAAGPMLAYILADVGRFAGTMPQLDDRTLLALSRQARRPKQDGQSVND